MTCLFVLLPRRRSRCGLQTEFPRFGRKILAEAVMAVVPEHMDVLNYAREAQGDPATWHAPGVEFKKNE
jgi:hypothetical protein